LYLLLGKLAPFVNNLKALPAVQHANHMVIC